MLAWIAGVVAFGYSIWEFFEWRREFREAGRKWDLDSKKAAWKSGISALIAVLSFASVIEDHFGSKATAAAIGSAQNNAKQAQNRADRLATDLDTEKNRRIEAETALQRKDDELQAKDAELEKVAGELTRRAANRIDLLTDDARKTLLAAFKRQRFLFLITAPTNAIAPTEASEFGDAIRELAKESGADTGGIELSPLPPGVTVYSLPGNIEAGALADALIAIGISDVKMLPPEGPLGRPAAGGGTRLIIGPKP